MTIAPQKSNKKALRREAPARKRDDLKPSTSVEEDKHICLAVEQSLRSSGYYSVREIRCFVEDGVVMLFGKVPSYYMKQVAQTVVMKLELVILLVENHCEVEYPLQRDGWNRTINRWKLQ